MLDIIDEATASHIIAVAQNILQTTGMAVYHPGLRDRLKDAGLMDDGELRLRFPPQAIAQGLAAAPRSFSLYNRDGREVTRLGGGRVHFAPGSSALYIQDHQSGRVRSAMTSDYIHYVRLADTLDHLAYLATAFSTQDVPSDIADAWRLYLHLTNSLQPVVTGAFTPHGIDRMARMLALFRRDTGHLRQQPFAICTITPSGNFRLSADSAQNLVDCLEWGIPIEIVPATVLGLSAPVTLIEAAAFHIADQLALLTMIQVLRPGHPVLLGGAPAAFHMREATSPMMAIEALRLTLISIGVARQLGLPSQAYLGFSDSKELDAQAGAETFGSALLAVLSGVDSVSGPGMLDYLMVFSLPKLILDNELCGQALQLASPPLPDHDIDIPVLVESLLKERHLLSNEHTRTHWQTHLHLPGPVYDRSDRGTWQMRGSPTLWQRAVSEVDQRLKGYQPVTTDERLESELRRLLMTGVDESWQVPETRSFASPTLANPTKRRRPARRTRARGDV